MQICADETGYVGLVTGACLAALGNQVTCVDNEVDKIKRLKTVKLSYMNQAYEICATMQRENMEV
jgi:UDP-glucose 6-dehydrogenase